MSTSVSQRTVKLVDFHIKGKGQRLYTPERKLVKLLDLCGILRRGSHVFGIPGQIVQSQQQ